MGLFKKRQDKVIDLTEHYRKQQEKLGEVQPETQASSEQTSTDSGSGNFFGGFFGESSTGTPSSEQETSVGETVNIEEKRRRLARRLKEMTDKLENLSNQVYHLQQRIELIERKVGVGG